MSSLVKANYSSRVHVVRFPSYKDRQSGSLTRCAICAGVMARGASVGREFTGCAQAAANSQIIAGVQLTAGVLSGILFSVRSREGAI